MGTGCEIGLREDEEGVLPRAARYLFRTITKNRQAAEAAVSITMQKVYSTL